MDRITIGIIGFGIMGERMLRAALEHAPDVARISGVWDPSLAAMERIASAFPTIPRIADPSALIAQSDCVYVASPPTTHLSHARAAIRAGKSVFCEKPLSVDVADSRAFVAEAGARGAVNFPFASSLAIERLRGWIDEGVIGKPQRIAIEVGFKTWPRAWQMDAAGWLDGRAEGGFTREVVSHFLFLTRRLGGPMRDLKSTIEFPIPEKSERAIAANFTAGELPVELKGRVGSTDKDDHNLWTLIGDRGAVRLRDWSIAERRMGDGAWEIDRDALPQDRARPLTLKRQLDGVARMTRGEKHPLATLQEAFEVQEIVEAILR
ncbi:Gfo/Idh/MocA family oxidoreductase [Terrarubrum flagellatum]|uniref:Gfo/Idh/MocA family protein n=1 Tax=Terrirubrum flagellatum TaxID=2895980 RepID=UPI0031450D2B